MAFETSGTVRMRGERPPGVAVQVRVDEGRLSIVSAGRIIGDWPLESVGVSSLEDGFRIRAGGRVVLLDITDDVAFAEQLGVVTGSPRLTRKIAAAHVSVQPQPESGEVAPSRTWVALAYGIGAALVVLGGVLVGPTVLGASSVESDYWLQFVFSGGLLAVATALLAQEAPRARPVAAALLVLLTVLLLIALLTEPARPGLVFGYGFVAGGVLVGAAALVTDRTSRSDEEL